MSHTQTHACVCLQMYMYIWIHWLTYETCTETLEYIQNAHIAVKHVHCVLLLFSRDRRLEPPSPTNRTEESRWPTVAPGTCASAGRRQRRPRGKPTWLLSPVAGVAAPQRELSPQPPCQNSVRFRVTRRRLQFLLVRLSKPCFAETPSLTPTLEFIRGRKPHTPVYTETATVF